MIIEKKTMGNKGIKEVINETR